MRIVSLVPSSTETLLGLGADVVACTRFCEQPDIAHVGGTKNPNIEAIVTPMVLPAMVTGSRLLIDRPVSPKFLENLGVVQDIFSVWQPWLEPLDIVAPDEAPPAASRGKRVGALFTGGVDSFYTLIKHQREITDLVFVHGYDIPLHKTELRAAASAAMTSW